MVGYISWQLLLAPGILGGADIDIATQARSLLGQGRPTSAGTGALRETGFLYMESSTGLGASVDWNREFTHS